MLLSGRVRRTHDAAGAAGHDLPARCRRPWPAAPRRPGRGSCIGWCWPGSSSASRQRSRSGGGARSGGRGVGDGHTRLAAGRGHRRRCRGRCDGRSACRSSRRHRARCGSWWWPRSSAGPPRGRAGPSGPGRSVGLSPFGHTPIRWWLALAAAGSSSVCCAAAWTSADRPAVRVRAWPRRWACCSPFRPGSCTTRPRRGAVGAGRRCGRRLGGDTGTETAGRADLAAW